MFEVSAKSSCHLDFPTQRSFNTDRGTLRSLLLMGFDYYLRGIECLEYFTLKMTIASFAGNMTCFAECETAGAYRQAFTRVVWRTTGWRPS